MATQRIKQMIGELRSWLSNYDNRDPNGYPVLVFRMLASLPGGEDMEDMGFEPLGGMGWHEADQLGRMLTVIENADDVRDLVLGLNAEEDPEDEPTIKKITKAYVRTYGDSGQTTAYVEWIDSEGKAGRIEGDPNGEHMAALFARARREGIKIEQEEWGPVRRPAARRASKKKTKAKSSNKRNRR